MEVSPEKTLENMGNTPNIWDNYGKTMEKPWENMRSFNHQRIGIYMGFHDNVYSPLNVHISPYLPMYSHDIPSHAPY
jgi:hypothetical protein